MSRPHLFSMMLFDDYDKLLEERSLIASIKPINFYLNLTERCQLDCLHCITQAPIKTRNATVRDMSMDVLRLLENYLRDASYIGLCHAGEPTLSSAFKPLLDIFSDVKSLPVIHLMTNGYNLDVERFRYAVDRGVCSWMISVDGLSHNSHDILRRGSSIEALKGRISEICDVRNKEYPNARIGISWTLTSKNLWELELLPEEAAKWGIDYIKFEELCPVNEDTKEFVIFSESESYPVFERLVQKCNKLGIHYVNHTHPIQVWKCLLERNHKLSHFSLSDDYANCTVINPCKWPYQTVYIDVNGDVKPYDFHSKSAGNVLNTDLMEIWNRPEFRAWRAEIIKQRPCVSSIPRCTSHKVN